MILLFKSYCTDGAVAEEVQKSNVSVGEITAVLDRRESVCVQWWR